MTTVLVADDLADNRAVLAEYLELRGFRPLQVKNGAEAVAATQAHLPDVVVLDLGMPVLDGSAAARILRADPRTRRTPLVLLTGYSLESVRSDRLEGLFDAIMSKPCALDQLIEVLTRLTSAPGRPREGRSDERERWYES